MSGQEGLGGLGEFGLIQALTGSLKGRGDVPLGVGDDCAILDVAGKQLLLTSDASLEDVHFKRSWGQPAELGWKSAVSALSDIAAMGGRPMVVLVTLALPDDISVDWVKEFYCGLTDAVECAGATIVGGDTTASSSGIVVDLTVIGEVVGRPVLRSGACPGDVVAMTGAIGERGAGLHALLAGIDAPEFVGAYLHPEPRIAAGQWLQGRSGVHAMMDVSDGLLPDARHIASASGVGVALWRDRLPIHRGLEAYWTAHGEDCVHQRLQSGEEYELLVVLDAEESVALCSDFFAETGLPLHVLGHCVDGPPIITLDGEPLARAGFEHFRDTPSE